MKTQPRPALKAHYSLILLLATTHLFAQMEPISLPSVNGKVYAILKDGNGGIFIGGDFTQVDGAQRSRLAHLLKDGSVDLSWNPSPNGIVRALEFFIGSQQSLVVGGDFTAINGQTRNHLASLNLDGTVSNWNPNVDGNVYALLSGGPSGSNVLFVGGEFTTIDGKNRNNLAYINNGGNVMSFDPNVTGGGVYSLYFSNNTLYLGGNFTSVSGTGRNATASIDYPNKLTSWAPVITSSGSIGPKVLSINQSGSLLFLGGQFDGADGLIRTCLAAYDLSSGTLSTAFNPTFQAAVNKSTAINTIAVLNTATVLVGGSFAGIKNVMRSNIAALSVSTGNPTSWDFGLSDVVNSIVVSNQSLGNDTAIKDYVFIGGQFLRGQHVVNTLLNQTITFRSIPSKKFGDAPFSLEAAASSGLPVSYVSKNTNVATILGSTVTILGAGTTLIVATQDGNQEFNAATSQGQVLTVDKIAQTITFNELPTKTFGDDPFDLTATATSGLTITYTSSNPNVATIQGSKLIITGGGTSSITASQAGNSNFKAATSVSQLLTVSKAQQTITFNPFQTKTYGDAPLKLTATSTSGLTVLYSSNNTQVATISGTTLIIVGAGTALISANVPGNSNYFPATEVSQSLVVNKADQSIIFQKITAPTKSGVAITLQASSNSGLPVSFSSSDEKILTITGSQATVLTSGRVVISASQKGNSNFNGAPVVNQELNIIITAIEPFAEIAVYPNPVEHEFYIKTPGSDLRQFFIFDHLGRLVRELSSYEELVRIDMTNLSSGLYSLRIEDNNGHQIIRLVKE